MSLLPSATEIVFALGRGDRLRGVTFECDHPEPARAVPQVSGTALATDGSLTPEQIDAQVAALVQAGEPIYTLDHDRIRAIAPDVILTQDLCRVCAVPSGAVDEALEVIGCRADVVSLDPHRLDDVIAAVGAVGRAVGAVDRAEALMADLRARVAAVTARVAGRERPRVLMLEWVDPPYSAGHWVPDMVEAAGGVSLLGEGGDRSRRLAWGEVAAVEPEVVVVMPCGFGLDDAVEQARGVLDRPELASARCVAAVDANGLFSRPGPRVVDGVEALAALLHPGTGSAGPDLSVPGAAGASVARLR